jgi:hypothetical protein
VTTLVNGQGDRFEPSSIGGNFAGITIRAGQIGASDQDQQGMLGVGYFFVFGVYNRHGSSKKIACNFT